MSNASIEADKKRFIDLCGEINRSGMDDLMFWLENSDFYTAPASTRFHCAYTGGLLKHSLNVYDELVRLLKAYPEIDVPNESVIIASLFHDLCKVDFYTVEQRFRKDEGGRWEKYNTFGIDEKFCYGGHGSKSVFLLEQFIRLTTQEAMAIHNHMGAWEDGAKCYAGAAYEYDKFAWLVHVADEAATYIRESEED